MFAFSSLSVNTLFCICFQSFDGRPYAFHLKIKCQGKKVPPMLQLLCVLGASSPVTLALAISTSPQILLWSHPNPDPSSSSESSQAQAIFSDWGSHSARPPLLQLTPLAVCAACMLLWPFECLGAKPLCLGSILFVCGLFEAAGVCLSF